MSSLHPGAVIYAKDLGRLARFYEHVVGLTVSEASDDYVSFDSGPFQLVLVRMPAHLANSVTIATPPERRTNAAIKPVFVVASLAAARAAAPRFGGTLDSPRREWAFQDAIVCDGCDPEGNVIQFRHRQPDPI